MNNIEMTKGRTILAIILILVYMAMICALVFIITGCKPSMPKREDFGDNDPCYMSAIIIVANTYTENKTPVDDALAKCFRYTDMEKCKKEKDFDDCWSKVGIRK